MRSVACALVWMSLLATILAADYPDSVVDTKDWKLTLPFAAPGETRAAEVSHLHRFVEPNCFFFDSVRKGVVFRASCGGAVTGRSQYPRCELRERRIRSKLGAEPDWATTDLGVHVLDATLAITHLPDHKPQVVCAQIHDAQDDLLMIRLEKDKLFVERNQNGDVELDPHYKLATFFELKIIAGQGGVKVRYNGDQKLDWKVSRDGCYFKAGCYTQSNVDKGDAPDAYGEVVIRRLEVRHTP